jgi:hypothetical protein
MDEKQKPDSPWALSIDLLSAKALVWIASVSHGGHADNVPELTPEAHRYFFDRYSRLAECHRRHGRWTKAVRLEAKAAEHGHPDGPPYAAALAMPRPRRFTRTDAIGRRRFSAPDDAA